MSSQCALEILEKNNLIKVIKYHYEFNSTDKYGKNGNTDVLPKLNIISLKIPKELNEFKSKLTEKLEDNGYIKCDYGKFFVHESEIKNFCEQIPQKEEIYIENMIYALNDIIKEKLEKRGYKISHPTYYPCSGVWGTLFMITNTNIKEDRINTEKQANKDAIDLLEKLF